MGLERCSMYYESITFRRAATDSACTEEHNANKCTDNEIGNN